MESIKWDGTQLFSLGETIKKCEFAQLGRKKIELWTVLIENNRMNLMAIPVTSNISCIADQLKSVLGIRPNGTHFFKSKGKSYLLIPYYSDILKLYKLKDCRIEEFTPKYQNKIRRLLTYRNLIGTYPNNEETIWVDLNSQIEPISLCENMTKLLTGTISGNYISRRIQNIWFQDGCYLQLDLDRDLGSFLNQKRDEIFRIIKRLDISQIYLTTHIYNRLSHQLISQK